MVTRLLTSMTVVLAVVAPAMASTIEWRSLKYWDIRIDNMDGRGICYMHTNYIGGDTFRVYITSDSKELMFMIGSPRWLSLQVGQRYYLSMQFGNLSPLSGHALGVQSPNEVKLVWKMGASETVISELVGEPGVRFTYQGRIIGHYALTDSNTAFRELARCQMALNPSDQSSDPFASVAPPKQTDPFDEKTYPPTAVYQ